MPNTELCCYTRRYAKEVCDAIVAKCLTGRPKTVEKAQAVFMLWVELEAVDAFLVCAFSRMFCVFNNLVQDQTVHYSEFSNLTQQVCFNVQRNLKLDSLLYFSCLDDNYKHTLVKGFVASTYTKKKEKMDFTASIALFVFAWSNLCCLLYLKNILMLKSLFTE